MEVKVFEFRDSATFIPVVCTRLEWSTPEEHYLLRRAGYANSKMTRANNMPPYIVCTRLVDMGTKWDPYEWGNRSMEIGHEFVMMNWDKVNTGDVIDVQFILGETTQKKVSERFDGV